MTRNTTITYEEVADAVRKIQSKGDAPTILRVKDELGNRGSTTTISKFVKQYKEGAQEGGANKEAAAAPNAPKSEPREIAREITREQPVREAPRERFQHENARPENLRPENPRPLIRPPVVQPVMQQPVQADLALNTPSTLPASEGSASEMQQQGQQNQQGGQQQQQPRRHHSQDGGQQQRRQNFDSSQSNQSRPRHNNPKQQQQSHRFDRNQDNRGQDNRGPDNRGQDRNQNGFKDRRPYSPYPVAEGPAMMSYPQDPYAAFEQEVIVSENLETMSENQLATKIRKLESMLNKEQARTESAEKMAAEAKQYAEAIKAQAGLRVADVKQAMETLIQQLRMETEAIKRSAADDLRYYREQLEKANSLVVTLTKDSKH